MADIYDSMNVNQLRIAKKAKEAAKEVGIPETVFLAALMQESGFDQSKISPTGPVGTGQLSKKAAIDAKIKDRYNEDENIIGSARYFKQQMDRNGGDIRAALIDYHDGPGTFKKKLTSPAANTHVEKVFGYIPQFGGTVPETKTGSSLPPLKRGTAAESDSSATGSMYDPGDILAGTAGALGGAFISSHKPRSAASVANELRAQGQKQGEAKVTNMALAEKYRDEMSKYNEALDLRNKSIQAAKEQQAGSSLQQYTNKMTLPGSSNVVMADPTIVTQAGVQSKLPQVQSNLQRATGIDPMATNIDPRTGLSLPFGMQKSPPPAPIESTFPMPERPVLETVPPAPAKTPYLGSNKGRVGTSFGTGLAAMEATNAIRRAEEGDIPGAALGTISAAGGAGTQLHNPRAAMLSGAVGATAFGAQQLYDYLRDGIKNLTGDTGIPPIDNYIKKMRGEQQPEEKSVINKAAGGLASLPKLNGGGNPKTAALKAAVKTGEQLIGREPSRLFVPRETKLMKFSEALAPHEGKYLNLTQTDNFGVHGGRMGGNQFPNFQNISPKHQEAGVVWMNDAQKHANDLVKGRRFNGKDTVYSTYIGGPEQLKSNKTVFNDILEAHYGRELTPEQYDLINQRIATLRKAPDKPLVFSQPFDIRDKFAVQELGGDTFEKRSALASMLGAGEGVGKTKGGIALPQYQDILRTHRDPLTEGVPTSSVGTRLFTVDDIPAQFSTEFHPDYNWAVFGKDQGVQFNPVPQRIAVPDWHGKYKERFPNKEPHGNAWFSYPKDPQFIDEKYLTNAQKEGYADGGLVHLQDGGSPGKTMAKTAIKRLATSAYDMLGLTPESVSAWKLANAKPNKQQQDPVLARALDAYMNKQISQADYLRIMNERRPIRPLTALPEAHSTADIVSALKSNQVEKGILGLNLHVPEGTRVGNRLDIPAYRDFGTHVDTMHDSSGTKVIGYGHTGHLKDVKFSSDPNKAARVGLGTKQQALTPMAEAEGQGKSPFAMMMGSHVNTSDDEVRRMLQDYLRDPEWHQIGMNPYRGSQFYDKADMMPVWSAKEKIQAGPLVLARDIEKSDWTDPRLMTDYGVNYKEGGLTGLYANIHAKQERIKHGSGEKMRKPGSEGAPTAEAFRKSAKTAKRR